MKIPDTLTGLVVDRCSPIYNEARMDFNSRFSLCPLYIVYAQDVHDVQTAILWARRHNLPLRVRSGGHSYEAYSLVNGGVVIDVSPLDKVILDRKRGRATIGAGADLTTVYTELWNQGKVTIPGGSCGGVGIAGLTLGGGFGLISRLLGLTCDALVSVEMVDANGRIIHASPNQNADLFWASCGGGGGNFGAVTEFTFNVHPVDKVTTFSLRWPWSQIGPVIKAFQNWADPITLDRRVVPLLALNSELTGHIGMVGQFIGPLEEMLALLQPLLAMVPPVQQNLQYVDYIDAVAFFGGLTPGEPQMFKNSSAFQMEPFSDRAINVIIDNLRKAPSAATLVAIDLFGGAVADRRDNATAFPYRRVRADLQYQAYWDDESEGPALIQWVENFRRAMLPFTVGAYANYIDREIVDWPRKFYNGNLPRLIRVKRKYDPDNVFNFPQGLGQLLKKRPDSR